eukprot:TRINITY_DN2817_c0_g1_i2.p1 TRINITY_DN2817_c0_g1~~TRINITY_DN2817_c0_g1_i2.p1  ORF type:complete len:330 (-),score=84.32 TRINITY_DN2817_c0_g1_i2:60-1049(-)
MPLSSKQSATVLKAGAGMSAMCTAAWAAQSFVGGTMTSRSVRPGSPPFADQAPSLLQQAALGTARHTGLSASLMTVVGSTLAVFAARRSPQTRRCRGLAMAAEPQQPPPKQDPEIDPRRQDQPTTVPPVRMPMIETAKGEKLDVMSKLLQDRIIILGGEVKDEMAQVLVAQMLYLANESNEDITMYINSPGGSVSAGMAIFDTMQFIPCDVSTVCFGMAASMGSFLLAAGTKGKRKSLPNSRIMIHQPLGGAQGQAADVRIQAREILHMREILNMHLADATGQTIEKIAADCDRDNFMTPEEAKEYGLIDDITPTKAWPRIQKPPRPEL